MGWLNKNMIELKIQKYTICRKKMLISRIEWNVSLGLLITTGKHLKTSHSDYLFTL